MGLQLIPNNGNDCPQFDDSISNPRLMGHLLSKGHKSGRFIVVPLSLAQPSAIVENRVIHSSTCQVFTTQF
jgi:hypothetical protein